MQARFKLTRETTNYFVYEAIIPDSKSRSVQTVYLPRGMIAGTSELEIIIGTREAHTCNCEYCTRRLG